MATNAVQEVFNPGMQKALIRIGLILAVVLVLVLAAVFAIRLFKKSTTAGGNNQQPNGGGINPDGTPGGQVPQNLKRLADDLKEAAGWVILCSDLRCDTILAIAELPDAQLSQLGAHYKSLYNTSLKETFDSFYISGCCFKDAAKVVDAKLKNIQERVKKLNI